jgi:hypothetical protein
MKRDVMGQSHGVRVAQRWVGAVLVPLLIGRLSVMTIVAGVIVLVLVLVVAAVAMGSAFARSATRRRACLESLQALLRLAPWIR